MNDPFAMFTKLFAFQPRSTKWLMPQNENVKRNWIKAQIWRLKLFYCLKKLWFNIIHYNTDYQLVVFNFKNLILLFKNVFHQRHFLWLLPLEQFSFLQAHPWAYEPNWATSMLKLSIISVALTLHVNTRLSILY